MEKHDHECRDCGGTIVCRATEEDCDAGRGWAGANDGCEECAESVRTVAYRTGDSARARTLTIQGIPTTGERIAGSPHFCLYRWDDHVKIAIPARRIVSVDR